MDGFKRYRVKPEVVEARQVEEPEKFLNPYGVWTWAYETDWIVRTAKGLHACSAGQFASTYEEVQP